MAAVLPLWAVLPSKKEGEEEDLWGLRHQCTGFRDLCPTLQTRRPQHTVLYI